MVRRSQPRQDCSKRRDQSEERPLGKEFFVLKEKVGVGGKPRVAEIVVRGRVVGNEVREVGRGQNL